MTSFDNREQAFEAKYAHDSEMIFKAEARRNKLVALWAAEIMEHQDPDAYVIEVIKSDFEEAGDEDVCRKLAADLGDKADEKTIRRKMSEYLIEAKNQVMTEN